ncbi:ornithine cyclodeaminase family protein [Streptomyces spectabilis]|uniref:Ornithine cyclodeaminase n=1 Tax=Streptomyces spectabilis TaxID=68270 RepID=A0A5P2XCY8_STRST|nr:ornithine cyclodeaminase [Streptomyces spectabilis]QEV62897.1 ornithine cyclodeaminase family protein [Streptomyces spectabilis]GGV05460.1 ornithine cyclodeaminase [Streptomyces spectabilis]
MNPQPVSAEPPRNPLESSGNLLPHIGADALARLVPMAAAVAAVEAALVGGGLDPEAEPDRAVVGVPGGQLLLMPSATTAYAGVKVASVTPDNPARGLPRIQGLYLLLDGLTHTPLALLDGIALTSLRTPAVSGAALRHLAAPGARRLLVFGTGPQAWGHVEAVRAVRPGLAHVDVVGRDRERLAAFVERCRGAGLTAAAATPGDVAAADVVCCCTTAREPLFDSALLAPHAAVAAVGSHEAAAREVDERLVGRATVVAEARAVATRECGDIVQAVAARAFDPQRLRTLGELVRGEVPVAEDRPRLFKSAGMAWQDLAVAVAAYERRGAGPGA